MRRPNYNFPMKFPNLISAVTCAFAWALLLPPSLMAESVSKINLNQPSDAGSYSVTNSLLGDYEALLKDQNDAPFGVFKLITGRNVWTASLETVGQAKRTAKGSFVLPQGANSVSLEAKFPATKAAPAVTLNFTLDGGSPFLFGTHGAGTLIGFKMTDSLEKTTNSIRYNLILDQGTVDALDQPAGKGWASGSFTGTGIGSFKGMLGDATACSFPLRLSVTGQAILWAQPYKNRNSFIGGVVDVDNLVPNANNYEALEASVSWVKVADGKTLSYQNGFTFNSMSVSGSRWLVPSTHKALGESLGWLGGEKCTVRTYGPSLFYKSELGAMNLPTEFRLDKAFKLIAPANASTIKWSGSVVRGTGAFSGSFTLPAGFATDTISGSGAVSGLLLQDEVWGITTGLGLMKLPITGAKGSFRTAALALEQYETVMSPPTPAYMALIPSGSFTMGDALDVAGDAHTVNVSTFYMAQNLVTKAQWDTVRTWGTSNGYSDLAAGAGKASNHPVQSISWFQMVKWCNARSQKEGLTPVYYTNDAQTTVYKTGDVNVTNAQVKWTANGYRLPTEAEWEKAARGGLSGMRFPWGDEINQLRANYIASYNYSYDSGLFNKRGEVYAYHPTYATGSTPYTSPVGSFAANGYGLNDMAGNVWQWCWDWYGTYDTGTPTDPRGVSSGTYRVFRGGSWGINADYCRVAVRNGSGPSDTNGGIGFRVARSSVP
jgi:formylglycine-generating enzyme required for sulfatase activity